MRKSKIWDTFITPQNIKVVCAAVIILFSFIFFVLPFFLFWKDSVITVHDNLDVYIPWFKMFKENKMLFAFDVPTKAYSGLSYLYYTHSINLHSLIYYIADDFFAYVITNTFAIVLGFVSMYYLLTKVFNVSWFTSICTAVCFSVLPVYQIIHIAVASLPLIMLIFFSLYNSKRIFTPKVFLLICYPLLSYFAYTGIFILGLWSFGTILVCIKTRKPNYNLIVGLLFLVAGYIVTDYRLFYIAIFLKEPLNRSIFNFSQDFLSAIKTIISYFVRGYYHAASLQTRIIFPIMILISVCTAVLIYRSYIRQSGESLKGSGYKDNPFKKIILGIKTLDKNLKVFLCLECIIGFFSIIAGIYDSGILNDFIKKYIPVLGGFNWGRFWILNRTLWYILFAISLELIGWEIQKISSVCYNRKIVPLPQFSFCLIIFFIALLQINAVISADVFYNDARATWAHFKHKIQHYDDEYITYNEFYSEPLFSNIKKEISYNDEMVVALGFHPAVLLYNGFNCIDGYNGVYPLSYMRRFRKLIEPEFLVNKSAMEYFDSWGGRCYIYNSELSYQPTRNKNANAVNLHINMEIFTHDFNGKYIISRAEIKNAKTLGVSLVGVFTDPDSIYTIFVYENNNT